MSNGLYLKTAFLQLSFAIKLWHYASNGLLDKDKFDIDISIKEESNVIVLTNSEFETYDDIVLSCENMISINFGIASTVLWECVHEKGIYTPAKLPNPLITKEEKLAGFSYMLRCCFAHGPAVPRWKIDKPKYLTQYAVGNRAIDLSCLNDKDFNYKDIGGYDTLWLLKNDMESLGMI